MHKAEEAKVEFPDSDLELAMDVLETEIGSMKTIVELLREPADTPRGKQESCPHAAGELGALRLIAEEIERILSQANNEVDD